MSVWPLWQQFLFTITVCLVGGALLIVYAVLQRSSSRARRIVWLLAVAAGAAAWGIGYRDWPGWTVALIVAAVADLALPWPPRLRKRQTSM